jgi:hypothetical protein
MAVPFGSLGSCRVACSAPAGVSAVLDGCPAFRAEERATPGDGPQDGVDEERKSHFRELTPCLDWAVMNNVVSFVLASNSVADVRSPALMRMPGASRRWLKSHHAR